MKTNLLTIIILISLTIGCITANAQLSMNSAGVVSIGTNPSQPNSTSGLDIFGNRGSSGDRNFSVTYPAGFSLANTELAGLAHIGSGTWTALYAKQGASSYAGYFDGYCYVNGNFYYTSDARLKDNFREIESPLNNVLKLKGLKYDFLPDTIPTTTKAKKFKEKVRKDNLGFKAQDVMKIAPELVIIDPASGNYAINYNGFIPMLVEALKEQQQIIAELEEKVITIENDCCNNNGNLKSGSINSTTTTINEAKLYQNTPNPFSVSTTIKYLLSKNINNATINIYNMNGTQLKSVELHQTGEGSIEINGSEFNAGIYLYALIADGQVINTKRMILTD